jgi:hypothetical protein
MYFPCFVLFAHALLFIIIMLLVQQTEKKREEEEKERREEEIKRRAEAALGLSSGSVLPSTPSANQKFELIRALLARDDWLHAEVLLVRLQYIMPSYVLRTLYVIQSISTFIHSYDGSPIDVIQ